MALFGKLPSHGDFVRRGDPALALRLDRWLTTELDLLAAADADLVARLRGFPVWCFALGEGLAGAPMPGMDRVGREYPLVACVGGGANAAEAVAAESAQATDADALHVRLQAIAGAAGEAGERIGWWRRDADDIALCVDALPEGEAFATLFRAGL